MSCWITSTRRCSKNEKDSSVRNWALTDCQAKVRRCHGRGLQPSPWQAVSVGDHASNRQADTLPSGISDLESALNNGPPSLILRVMCCLARFCICIAARIVRACQVCFGMSAGHWGWQKPYAKSPGLAHRALWSCPRVGTCESDTCERSSRSLRKRKKEAPFLGRSGPDKK